MTVLAWLACPDCSTAVATRASIRSDPDFWIYVAILILPFVVVAIVVAALHQIGRTT